jgi:anti-sigma B factor antagonist
MATNEFTARLRRRGEMAILDLAGDFDREAEAPLRRAYEAVMTDGQPGHVLLNFTGVGYINSTGIAVIVQLLARAQREQHTITAFGLGEHYRRVFTITRLSDFIDLYDDENAAVASAART